MAILLRSVHLITSVPTRNSSSVRYCKHVGIELKSERIKCKAVAWQKGGNGDMGKEQSQYFMLGKLHGYLLLQQLLEQAIMKNSATACFAGRTCSGGSCGISAVLGAVGASSGHNRGDREKSMLV